MISAVKRAGEAKLGIPLRQSVPFGWGGIHRDRRGEGGEALSSVGSNAVKTRFPCPEHRRGRTECGGEAKDEWRGSLELLGNGKDVETAAGNGAKRTRKQHSGDWQDLAGLVGPGRTMGLT